MSGGLITTAQLHRTWACSNVTSNSQETTMMLMKSEVSMSMLLTVTDKQILHGQSPFMNLKHMDYCRYF